MNEKTKPAGWGFPTQTARKEHWWAEGDSRSGCGKYGRFLIETNPAAPDFDSVTCAACKRKFEAAV